MLTVDNLNITLRKSGFSLVCGLSFTLNKGDKIAVIGSEGTGKSTLLKGLSSNHDTDHVEMNGNVICHGRIGYLEQDIKKNWHGVTVQDYLVKKNPEDSVDYSRFEKLKNLGRILDRLGLNMSIYDENRFLGHLSGGEVVKLGLAKLLLEENDILLLDEPTNDLDFETILFLESFIKNETRPILYVSHDEALLEETANGIVHLQRIRKMTEAKSFFERMTYLDYKNHRLNHYESALMRAKKQRSEHRAKMEKFRQVYQKVAHQQDQAVRVPSAARLLAKKIKSMKSMERRFEKERVDFVPIPEKEEGIEIFFNREITLPKGRRVMDFHLDTLKIGDNILSRNIDLDIVGPKKIAIVGRNGCGKSTLLTLFYDHIRRKSNLSVGFMPQSYEDLNRSGDVLAFLEANEDRNKEAVARKMLGALAFQREEMTMETRDLSGGQRAKLYLLKMILNENTCLLLDEPTRNLSPLSAPHVHDMLSQYGGVIIAVTHDRKFIEDVFDEVYTLDEHTLKKSAG